MKSLAWSICRKLAVGLVAIILLMVALDIISLFATDRVNSVTMTTSVSVNLKIISSLTPINLLNARRTENYFCLRFKSSGICKHISPVQSPITTHHPAAAEGAHLTLPTNGQGISIYVLAINDNFAAPLNDVRLLST